MTCVCASKQAILCIAENTNNKLISFLTFVYASNSGLERRILWKDINRHKVITNGHPWAISGDFNVTLKPNEHSAGSSSITNDMMDFRDYKPSGSGRFI
ncbi:RNA-directed DNA polymerase, eukaryota, reverse transcriptase zinc-binding domain protein, partial [Tanacetum coccineum]